MIKTLYYIIKNESKHVDVNRDNMQFFYFCFFNEILALCQAAIQNFINTYFNN